MAKILLAENDSNWSALERKVLEEVGHSVIHITNASAAIDYLITNKTPDLIINAPDLIITDLHMNGDNGHKILEYILENYLNTPLVIASGTLSDRAKKIIGEGILSMFQFSKEDFLDPPYVAQKIKQILENPFPHYPSQAYLDNILKAKGVIDLIPDIDIQTDRIKGRVFALIEHYKNRLEKDYELLKEFHYYGLSPEQTTSQIHELKNTLSGMANAKYKNESELQRNLLLIADDIVQIINMPTEESMPLLELLIRLTPNLEKIYQGITAENNVPENVRISNPSLYSHILYLLIENAANAAWNSGNKELKMQYDPTIESLIISNKGELPSDWLTSEGFPIPEIIKSTKAFGTAYGIIGAFSALQSIGKPLSYLVEGDTVYTKIGLDVLGTVLNKSDVTNPAKPKVLFLDYTDGQRFTGIERIIEMLDKRFDCIWSPELNWGYTSLKEYDFDEHFLVVIHPDTIMQGGRFDFLMSEDVVRKTLDLRYGVVSLESIGTFDRRIKIYQEILDEEGIKKNLLSHKDFHIGNFPTAERLNQLISSSYEKYQAKKLNG